MAEIVDFGLQKHKIKMDSRYFENVLSVVAGDTGRRLEVQLLDTNGMVQNTTGLNLRLNALVAGKATFTDATLVDVATGKYQLDLSNGMFLAPGNWQFQWQITDSAGKKLHSFAFTGNIGKNISEGGSQATNFYLNLEDLKKMQDDLINGTIDSSILETNIAEKLTDLEMQYAPKLTEVTAQFRQTENKVFNQKAINHASKKGSVVFIDDDGRKDFYTKWKPILTRHKISVVCALVTSKIGVNPDSLTWEQVTELKELGVEFVSHTHTHANLKNLTEPEIRGEYELSVKVLKEHGLNHEILVYPYGDTSLLSREIAREYFTSAIDVLEGVNKPPFDTFKMYRKGWFESGRTTAKEHVDLIDQVALTGDLLIFKFHSQYPAFVGEQLNAIDNVINQAKLKNVEILSISDALNKKGNLVDSGDLFTGRNVAIIDSEGEGHGSSLGSTLYVRNSQLKSNINGHISEFKENCLTIVNINNAEASLSGLSGNIGGFVEVLRDSNPTFGERTHRQYRTGLVYNSFWDNETKTWSKWNLVNVHRFLGVNGIPLNVGLRDLGLENTINTTYITASNATGFPEGKAGKYTVDLLTSSSNFPNREYVIYNTNKTYKSFWDGVAWGEWELVPVVFVKKIEADFGSVEAGKVKQLIMTVENISITDQVIATPFRSIDESVLWFASVGTTNQLRLKVFNASESPITIKREFNITVIKQ